MANSTAKSQSATHFNFSAQQLDQLRQLSLADFDFVLPAERIAQHPCQERSKSRLLDGRSANLQEYLFNHLAQLLTAEDLLVFNDTKVVKARLLGRKTTGGKVEILVERVLPNHSEIIAHFKSNRKPENAAVLAMQGGYTATLIRRWPDENGNMFLFRLNGDAYQIMDKFGHVPLPPYINHADSQEDEQRYQTIFAENPGAVAAPTAALHFDHGVLQDLAAKGIATTNLTLHVGAGTFQPIKSDDILQHHMHFERYQISPQSLAKIEQTRRRGGRIVAVGTTTVRALESYALTKQTQGDTDIFITPGFEFKLVDLLITNFHLPKSTLLLLVAAFSGQQRIKQLYQYAIAQKFRFFSYGDAMLLARK